MKSEELKILFDKWEKEQIENSFLEDGVVCPDIYDKESKRILFILKEPHDDKSDERNSQIDSYRAYIQGTSDDDFNGMMPKLGGLYSILTGSYKNEQSTIEVKDALKRIAYMNLKKSGGGSRCVNKNLVEYIEKHRQNIIEQIKIINPDYIVCSGTFDIFIRHVLLGNKLDKGKSWRSKNIDKTSYNGKTYIYRIKENKDDELNYEIIFNMHHTSCYGISIKDYLDDFNNNYNAVIAAINEKNKD